MAVPLDAIGRDPLAVFAEWRAACEGTFADPDAVALATATPEGRPSVRHVLLRGISDEGVRFFTNYDSRKGTELARNPFASVAWFDPVQRRAVRIEGTTEQLDAAASDAYFASRDRGHQLGAVASNQSETLADRAAIERAYLEAEQRFKGRDVDRPERWGGYLLRAERVELWLQRDDRLHDRFVYTRDGATWSAVRVAP
jgi:pyridoxamine 5'-phosphate oxidase